MTRKISKFDTYMAFRDRVKGSGVQKLDKATPKGFKWIRIDREKREATLHMTRDEARA
jgi:hypothetical protein